MNDDIIMAIIIIKTTIIVIYINTHTHTITAILKYYSNNNKTLSHISLLITIPY